MTPTKRYVQNLDSDRTFRFFFRALILVFVVIFLGVCANSVISYSREIALKSQGIAIEAQVLACCDIDKGGIPGVAADVLIESPSGSEVMVHVPFAQRADPSDPGYAYYTEHNTLPVLFDPRDPTHATLNLVKDAPNTAVLREAIIRPLAVGVIEGVIALLMMAFRTAPPVRDGAARKVAGGAK